MMAILTGLTAAAITASAGVAFSRSALPGTS